MCSLTRKYTCRQHACMWTQTHSHTLTGGQAGTQTCIIKWTKIQRQSYRNIHTLTQWQFSSVPALHLVFTHGLSHTHWREPTVVLYQYILPRSLSLSHTQSPSLSLFSLSLSLWLGCDVFFKFSAHRAHWSVTHHILLRFNNEGENAEKRERNGGHMRNWIAIVSS